MKKSMSQNNKVYHLRDAVTHSLLNHQTLCRLHEKEMLWNINIVLGPTRSTMPTTRWTIGITSLWLGRQVRLLVAIFVSHVCFMWGGRLLTRSWRVLVRNLGNALGNQQANTIRDSVTYGYFYYLTLHHNFGSSFDHFTLWSQKWSWVFSAFQKITCIYVSMYRLLNQTAI